MQPGEDVPQSFGPEKGAMKRSEHLGKIKKRLQDAKAQGAQPTKLDLSSNESGRLAIDALLDGGEEAYRRVLREEGEVDFLSAAESRYVLESCHAPPCSADAAAEDDENGSLCSWNPPRSESVEPLLLPGCNATDKHYLKDKTSTTFHFQDEKSNSIRESIRRCIHRTSQVLIIVMDEFTDIVIFCDILEAAHKRNVFVYLLLEHSKLKLFTEMCDMLQLEDIHLENIFVRSIMGEVYCAKSGKKFSGLNQEKFLISDWRFVLAGSYSFTWLSGHVHRNILFKFTGKGVELFDEEFRYLYGLSKPVRGLKSPVSTTPVPLCENNATRSIPPVSSTQESANTRSEHFSSSSENNQPPTSPMYSVASPTSPLQRFNFSNTALS